MRLEVGEFVDKVVVLVRESVVIGAEAFLEQAKLFLKLERTNQSK